MSGQAPGHPGTRAPGHPGTQAAVPMRAPRHTGCGGAPPGAGMEHCRGEQCRGLSVLGQACSITLERGVLTTAAFSCSGCGAASSPFMASSVHGPIGSSMHATCEGSSSAVPVSSGAGTSLDPPPSSSCAASGCDASFRAARASVTCHRHY